MERPAVRVNPFNNACLQNQYSIVYITDFMINAAFDRLWLPHIVVSSLCLTCVRSTVTAINWRPSNSDWTINKLWTQLCIGNPLLSVSAQTHLNTNWITKFWTILRHQTPSLCFRAYPDSEFRMVNAVRPPTKRKSTVSCWMPLWPQNVVKVTKSGTNGYSSISILQLYHHAKFDVYHFCSVSESRHIKVQVTPLSEGLPAGRLNTDHNIDSNFSGGSKTTLTVYNAKEKVKPGAAETISPATT